MKGIILAGGSGTGTHESLLDVGSFVTTIQKRQGFMVACLGEIALQNEWINLEKILEVAKACSKTEYGANLLGLTREGGGMAEGVLITGGAGFIGSNLVHHWRRNHPDDLIVVLDKLTYAADRSQIDSLEGVNLVVGDIQDLKLTRELLEKHRIRKVFHLAAESHVDRSIAGPETFFQTNVMGTFSLLEATRQVWAGQQGCRFLHVSIDEVYGSLGGTGKFHEEMAYAPNSPYSASKAGSDHLVRAYHHTYGLDTVTTNCSNNYGPRQYPEKLIPLVITRMAKGEPIPIYGDGQNIRDWLFVEDHCAALEAVMAKGVPGETYCVGGNNERTNLDLVDQLCGLVDRQLGRLEGTSRSLKTFVQDRAGHDRRNAIDATKIQTALGWRPLWSFEKGLEATVCWYLHRFLDHSKDGHFGTPEVMESWSSKEGKS